MLTFLKAKEICSKYNKRGGSCLDDPSLNQFTISVLQWMLWNAAYGNMRQFTFCSYKSCVTIPFELEVIEKVKIDGRVSTSFDKWFEFHSATVDWNGCAPVARAMQELTNYYPTIYDVPEGGSRVGVFGTCNEDPSASIIIKGVDPTGREIVTVDNGEQIVGEKLYIRKGEVRYSQAVFAQITGVVKTQTIGYATLLWVDPAANLKGFLSDYSPLEEIPAYRRYKLTDPRCVNRVQVIVLGRIRLKEAYADSDIIPFESIYTINLAAQTINLSNNRAIDLANGTGQLAMDMIEKENSYKQVANGSPVEYFLPLSGGAIQNVVGGGMYGGGFGGRWRS